MQQMQAVHGIEPGANSTADVILPSQFFQLAGRRGLSSEQRLMLAVLADAINILYGWRHSSAIRKRQLYLETEAWVFGRWDERAFSFDYVCDALGINPESLRQRLSGLQNGEFGARLMPSRLRLKESSRAQHLTPHRVRRRNRRRRALVRPGS